ncbi:MAG: M15 family metallopeptidase [Acidobacteriia bacterium]|nr:M15 family metallopeptidase [Terriglobia bacterium]
MTTWPLQRDCDAFYGNPRGSNGSYSPAWAAANLTHVACPWQIQIGGKTVPFITIHRKCAESLTAVLGAIWEACGKSQDQINKLHYNVYDGSFNYRPMRANQALSMHAYGCAIDWDAAENPFHDRKHLFTSSSLLVVKFEAEGWVWGGDWSSPDAMHVQAARVHN